MSENRNVANTVPAVYKGLEKGRKRMTQANQKLKLKWHSKEISNSLVLY